VDEAALIDDLISALHGEAAAHPGPQAPVIAAFHVGITRVEGDSIRGSAVTRIIGLLRDLSPVAVPAAAPVASLVVGISASLYDDISMERDFSAGWLPLPASEAVCRAYY
jgi:hypothetical protein